MQEIYRPDTPVVKQTCALPCKLAVLQVGNYWALALVLLCIKAIADDKDLSESDSENMLIESLLMADPFSMTSSADNCINSVYRKTKN